jgi:uncharacterized protein
MKDRIDPVEIIGRHCRADSVAYGILIGHGRAVAAKSLLIARRLVEPVDLAFIEEAALLHDIGMLRTRMPRIGCYGRYEYICHGYLGRELLEKEGLHRHALVCERHVGVGITLEEIDQHRLEIPRREMLPLSIEEKVICYADKFFSKRIGELDREKNLEEVRAGIGIYGPAQLARFDELHALFNR